MPAIIPGPTYAEMRDPSRLPPLWQAQARKARTDERDPANLFNLTWRRPDGAISHLVIPPSLTGVAATIIMLIGATFPSGSHKVGPAYATLAEAEALAGVRPGTKTLIGPSTGNFGIGTAYVSLLKGYAAMVVMPDGMSRERYERIRQYEAGLDLTHGSESAVLLTLERTYEKYAGRERYLVLSQFELWPNYRFHRLVTGDAALQVAANYGNGRIAAFVAAPGSAGTLAAGDAIKARYADAMVVALEPRECATLYRGAQGQHMIEGIGDTFVSLIHNVLTTDYVALVHDADCVRGLRVLAHNGAPSFAPACRCGRAPDGICMRDCFGLSAVCNLIGAIKTAKLLGLGPQDNLVTVATDGFDRYPSVLAELDQRAGTPDAATLDAWGERIFHGADTTEMLAVNNAPEQARLHAMKEQFWRRFGHDDTLFQAMRGMAYWDEQATLAETIDQRISELRD